MMVEISKYWDSNPDKYDSREIVDLEETFSENEQQILLSGKAISYKGKSIIITNFDP